jgi:hypothetical protein
MDSADPFLVVNGDNYMLCALASLVGRAGNRDALSRRNAPGAEQHPADRSAPRAVRGPGRPAPYIAKPTPERAAALGDALVSILLADAAGIHAACRRVPHSARQYELADAVTR